MILCDNNIQLVITTDAVRIMRSNSCVKYDIETFEKENIDTMHGMVREYETRLYEYIGDAIVSHKINETRDFPVGSITDFHKVGNEFYFVKNDINSMCVVDGRNTKVLSGFSQHFFDQECVFYMVEEKNKIKQFYKHNFKNGEKVEVARIINDVVLFIANKDYLVYTNQNNEIHVLPIQNDGPEIVYHYHSNKIKKLVFFKNYVISVGKDGKVVSFGLEHNEKRLLFLYEGHCLNMKVFANKVFLLTELFFKVFDLGTENEIYSEVLPLKSKYSHVKYVVREEERTDIFKSKKKSVITVSPIKIASPVCKSIETSNLEINETTILTQETTSCEKYCVAFTNNNYLFLVSENCLFSMFKLANNLNFITGNKLVSVKTHKKKFTFSIFDICKDKLVLINELSFPSFVFDSVFYLNDIFYFRNANDIFTVSPITGFINILFTASSPFSIFHNTSYLLILDSKGIYDVLEAKYILKQSKVSSFCIVDSYILFYISNQGLYINKSKQKQLLNLSILDIIYHNGLVKILHIVEGTGRLLTSYKLNKAELIKVSEECVDPLCSKIVYDNLFETIYNQLIYYKK